ncbi:hypothetical protein ACOTHJ_13175 [Achromobacter xylosoxidans]
MMLAIPTREALVAGLTRIAGTCRTGADVQVQVNKEYPGVSVTLCYLGDSFMGMAMSHYHDGVISFNG